MSEDAVVEPQEYQFYQAMWDFMTEDDRRFVVLSGLILLTLAQTIAGIWFCIRRNKEWFVPYCILTPLPALVSLCILFHYIGWLTELFASAGIAEIRWPSVWLSFENMVPFQLFGVGGSSTTAESTASETANHRPSDLKGQLELATG
jgi:hypothetical protein